MDTSSGRHKDTDTIDAGGRKARDACFGAGRAEHRVIGRPIPRKHLAAETLATGARLAPEAAPRRRVVVRAVRVVVLPPKKTNFSALVHLLIPVKMLSTLEREHINKKGVVDCY